MGGMIVAYFSWDSETKPDEVQIVIITKSVPPPFTTLPMHNPYPMRLITLLLASTFGLTAHGQSPKPATSAEIKLTEFAGPPFPIEVIGMKAEGMYRVVVLQPETLRPRIANGSESRAVEDAWLPGGFTAGGRPEGSTSRLESFG